MTPTLEHKGQDTPLDRSMPPAVRRIILEVAAAHRLRPADMVDHGGPRSTVRVRHEAYARIRSEIVVDHKPPSLPMIGRWVGRHHTAVLHGLKRQASGFEWRRDRRAGVST